MERYRKHIAGKRARDRSQLEHWYAVSRVLMDLGTELPADQLGCAPLDPPPAFSWRLVVGWALVATLVCLALLLTMSWMRGWRQPFGRMEAVPASK